MQRLSSPGLNLARLGVWLVAAAIFIVPLAMVVSLALGGNQFPVLVEQGLARATWNSVMTTVLSSIGAVLIGGMIAIVLERTDVGGATGLRLFLLSPLLVPPFVGAISWLQLFGRNQGLNALFQQLAQQQVQVLSLRNKTNRLEELFVSLVEKNLAKVAQ